MYFHKGKLLSFETDVGRLQLRGLWDEGQDDPRISYMPETIPISYFADLANWIRGNEMRKSMHRLEREALFLHSSSLVRLGYHNRGLLLTEDLLRLSIKNRLSLIARIWDCSRNDVYATLMRLSVGEKRMNDVLVSLRKKVWVNRLDTRETSIQDTAAEIRDLIKEVLEERSAQSVDVPLSNRGHAKGFLIRGDNGSSTIRVYNAADVLFAVEKGHAYVVCYQHQYTGPGLTPVAKRLSDAQIVEIATFLTDHGMSAANQVHLAFDFTSVVGARSEKENVSWAATGLDVFKFAQVIYVSADSTRHSSWREIESNCGMLYGTLLARDPKSQEIRGLGSPIEFQKAEIMLAKMLLENLIDSGVSTMWLKDIQDLRAWSLKLIDSVNPMPNGMIPMLEAASPMGVIEDFEETWISLLSNRNQGLLGNFRKIDYCWEFKPYRKKWEEIGVSERMLKHMEFLDEALWGLETSGSTHRKDYLFHNTKSSGQQCFVIITNIIGDRRHAWLIKSQFREELNEYSVRIAPKEIKLCPYNALRALEWESCGQHVPIDELCGKLGMTSWEKPDNIDMLCDSTICKHHGSYSS